MTARVEMRISGYTTLKGRLMRLDGRTIDYLEMRHGSVVVTESQLVVRDMYIEGNR